jgi:hypothetical protein
MPIMDPTTETYNYSQIKILLEDYPKAHIWVFTSVWIFFAEDFEAQLCKRISALDTRVVFAKRLIYFFFFFV